MATKSHPYTTKISYSSDGSTYTDLTDVKGITPPNMSTGDTEITWLQSASAAREYIASWIEGGEVSFMMYFVKAQFNTLRGTIFAARVTYYWRITFPLIGTETTASRVDWQGHINGLEMDEVTIDDNAINVPVKIKVTGLPTFTAGT